MGTNYCGSGEMVYSGDLKSPAERHAGSSPASRTKVYTAVAQLDLEQSASTR